MAQSKPTLNCRKKNASTRLSGQARTRAATAPAPATASETLSEKAAVVRIPARQAHRAVPRSQDPRRQKTPGRARAQQRIGEDRQHWAVAVWPVLGRNSRAASAGLSVSELKAEMIVDTAIVRANCRKNCPVMPVMNAQGTKTALRTSPTAITGPETWLMALMAPPRGGQAVLDVVFDRLDHDDRVVHHDADGQHQSEERQVIQAESHQAAMTAKVPTTATGTATSGMIADRQFCRNKSTTNATSNTASTSVTKTSEIDSVMKGVVS